MTPCLNQLAGQASSASAASSWVCGCMTHDTAHNPQRVCSSGVIGAGAPPELFCTDSSKGFAVCKLSSGNLPDQQEATQHSDSVHFKRPEPELSAAVKHCACVSAAACCRAAHCIHCSRFLCTALLSPGAGEPQAQQTNQHELRQSAHQLQPLPSTLLHW
jgi:hypothetical protein